MMNRIKDFKKEKGISFKEYVLGFQHLLAMFGATTLVPLLTGFSVPVALFSAGVGTLIFHMITEYKVPIFLGSSFAFIPAVILVAERTGSLQYAQGGIIAAGLFYVLFSFIVSKVGVARISNIFKPHIVGTMIFIIGITLVPTAVGMIQTNIPLGLLVAGTAIAIQVMTKGLFKQASIVIAIAVGYVDAMFFKVVDFTPITSASWLDVPNFTLPLFDWTSILMIAPIVLAVFMEHIGDVVANQTITGGNYLEDPGLHKTLLGDGVATIFAGFVGGPANTTYSENTGILALTKNYNPRVLRIAAVFAILISFSGKIAAIFAAIPTAVLGGISIILFAMISIIGLKTLYKDSAYTSIFKLITISLMLVFGLGIEWCVTDVITISSMSLAAIVGVASDTILNQIKF